MATTSNTTTKTVVNYVPGDTVTQGRYEPGGSGWKGQPFQAAQGTTITATFGRQQDASYGGIEVSTDGGRTWKIADQGGITSSNRSTAASVTVTDPKALYRVTGSDGNPPSGDSDNVALTSLKYTSVNQVATTTSTTTTKTTNNYSTSTTTEIPVTINEYSISSSTSSRTQIQRIPSSTIAYNTTSITRKLFRPNLSGQITIDNIFDVPDKLSGPFIDLASYIQKEIN